MNENIENFRKDGIIDLDKYLNKNPSEKTYPYYIDGYEDNNFWLKVKEGGEEKYIYVKPVKNEYLDNNYNVYSELLYEELMKQVGIKTVSSNIAKYDNKLALISDNIISDYSYNQFIINGDELLECKKYLTSDEEYNIEDLFEAIHEYCRSEGIDKSEEKECVKDIEKACIADIFTLSTDRKVNDFDFIVGNNENDEQSIELAPLSHNTYSLGSNFNTDEIYDMLDDDDMLADRMNLCYFDAGVPDYKREYEYPYWEDTLYYLIDKDEENLNFTRECANNMNIDDAINCVEKKIDAKLPFEYKEFVRVIWDNRLQNICECLGIDYLKLMDNKYYEKEMEEV